MGESTFMVRWLFTTISAVFQALLHLWVSETRFHLTNVPCCGGTEADGTFVRPKRGYSERCSGRWSRGGCAGGHWVGNALRTGEAPPRTAWGTRGAVHTSLLLQGWFRSVFPPGMRWLGLLKPFGFNTRQWWECVPRALSVGTV